MPADKEDLGDVDEDMSDAIDTKGGSQKHRDKEVEKELEFYNDEEKDKGERNVFEQDKIFEADVGKINESKDVEHGVTLFEHEQAEIDQLNKEGMDVDSGN